MQVESFKTIISDSIQREYHARQREIKIPLDLNKIISIIGPRRSGKTMLLFHLIFELRKLIPRENLLYINFEDDRLFPIELEDMDKMLKAYFDLYPNLREQKAYFFFDEIQEVPHWEKFIRRIYDQLDCKIFLTGSSSRFLSKEIATSLRGRTISYEVFPLSFREYLDFKNINADIYSSSGQSLIRNALHDFLYQGGFPELTGMEWETGKLVIQEYIDMIIYRDMIERHNIQNQALLKYMVKYLFVNLSNSLSTNKMYNDLRSQGFKMGRTTIYNYLDHLQDAYLVFQVQKYSRSVREQAVNPKKIYGIDNGIKRAMSVAIDSDRLFENVIFLELRRYYKEIFYWRENQEVDFFIQGKHLINAALDISDPNTRKREINGLWEACQATGLTEATLVTSEEEDKILVDGNTIHIIPLWKWLLTFNPVLD